MPYDVRLPLDQGLSLGLSTTLVGLLIVFIGLILLVLLCWLMSRFVSAFFKKPVETKDAALVSTQQAQVMPNRPELAAAIAASIATSMDVMPGGLRILSIKRKD